MLTWLPPDRLLAFRPAGQRAQVQRGGGEAVAAQVETAT